MAKYFVYNGGLYSTDELKHYGVKGMKWGVHKSVYKSMNKQQRKAQRQKYKQTPEGRIERATKIGTYLGGPLGGVIANRLASKRVGDISPKTIEKGKNAIEKNNSIPVKTESKRVSDIKSRVTGKKENGKPGFLMTSQERDDFEARYMERRKQLGDQYKAATDAETKKRIMKQYDRLEEDYLSVVEQDFWYSDD